MAIFSIESHINTLNKWDVYPGISTIYSGPARILAGAVQIIAGAVLAIVSATFGWLNNRNTWIHETKKNIEEIGHGVGNLIRGIIACCPFAGNLAIYLYEKSTPKVILQRDTEGYYTLPHLILPGFVNMGTIRSREFTIHRGDFILDTENGILPEGWVLR